MERKIKYFDRAGVQNREETLRIARQRADELGIQTVVVASTEGTTAAMAVDIFEGMKVVVVTHAYGRIKPNYLEFKEENRQKVESKGGKILTTTHAFTGLDLAMQKRFGMFLLGDTINSALNIFGNGIKVACQVSMMAADAGLVRTDEDIIAIAGSHRGADAAIVITPVYTGDFFDLQVKEILCKPYTWEKRPIVPRK